MSVIRTTAELINFLSKMSGPVKAKLKTRTEATMRKKDIATKSIINPFDVVYKLQELEVELNANYTDTVNDSRLMEGKQTDFEAKPLPWGSAYNNILIEKDGKWYIKTIVTNTIGKATYISNDGRIINKIDLDPFLPLPSTSSRQGLDDKVIVRTFKMESILEIDFGKVQFIP